LVAVLLELFLAGIRAEIESVAFVHLFSRRTFLAHSHATNGVYCHHITDQKWDGRGKKSMCGWSNGA
jgi:hypothetical protein